MNKNIAARAQATMSRQVERASTPNTPSPPNSANEAKSTTKMAVGSDSFSLCPARRGRTFYICVYTLIRVLPIGGSPISPSRSPIASCTGILTLRAIGCPQVSIGEG